MFCNLKFPTSRNFWLLFGFCALSSGLGILVGAFISYKPVDGQRGGAVAVAAALWNLFMNRGYGRRLAEARENVPSMMNKVRALMPARTGEQRPPNTTGQTVTAASPATQTKAVNRRGLEDKEQRRQNVYLAWATAIGTIVSGFGDIAVKHIICWRHITPIQ